MRSSFLWPLMNKGLWVLLIFKWKQCHFFCDPPTPLSKLTLLTWSPFSTLYNSKHHWFVWPAFCLALACFDHLPSCGRMCASCWSLKQLRTYIYYCSSFLHCGTAFIWKETSLTWITRRVFFTWPSHLSCTCTIAIFNSLCCGYLWRWSRLSTALNQSAAFISRITLASFTFCWHAVKQGISCCL